MQPLPDTNRLPIPQPSPASRATAAAQLLRQQAPWAPGPQDEDDATERGASRDAGATARGLQRLMGQQRLDGLPEVVGNKL
jgi:hypothetical protein